MTAPPLSVTLDQLDSVIGREFVGSWCTIGEDRVRLFEDATFEDVDQYSWNVDDHPKDFVEGFHSLALLIHLINDAIRIDDPEAFGLNYGLDRVRFVTPIFAADRIRARGRIAEVRDRPDGRLARYDVEVEIEGRDRPGYTAVWWGLWLPRAPQLKRVSE